MNWTEGDIAGVVIRPLKAYQDARGWLAEVFRTDELTPDHIPAMGYVSVTRPGIGRGPHEHRYQTDLFGILGPGTFRVRLWDNRKDSPTHGRMRSLECGEHNPVALLVPPGVVHGYINISSGDAWVVNFPNRLFKGEGRTEPVDEIRHEGVADSPFRLE